jgi:acetyl-CoA hydrolase
VTQADWLGTLPPRGPARAARRVGAAEAVAAIPEGARVFVEGGAMTPRPLVDALDEQRGRWHRLELVTPYLMTRLAPFAHAGEPFRFVTLQASPAFKHLWASGAVDILPCRYADLARLCGAGGPLPCDAALVQVSPPGPEGKVSLGLSVGANLDVVRSAPLVIAQVNAKVPYTFGAGELDLDELDYLVEVDGPVLEARPADTSDDVSRAIAALAARHVPERATLQFGIGALPDAILTALTDRRGLRVHSGMVSDACVDLYEAGAVDGPMITAEIISTPRMVRWVHRNRAVLTAPAGFSHGAAALSAQPRFTGLNSTVEVALDGSCNSEVVAGEVISGPGGAPDFAFGASVAAGGRSIIALRSTAGGGRVSRIVPRIEPPAPVTLPAYLADLIVTEHGVADVRGLPLGQRAEAIISVAAPQHREALRARAR